MRNDRVLQRPIGGQDQRREPPARSGQSPFALIEAKLNPLRQTHGKTPTELPCAQLLRAHPGPTTGLEFRVYAAGRPALKGPPKGGTPNRSCALPWWWKMRPCSDGCRFGDFPSSDFLL